MRIPNHLVTLPHPYNNIGDGPEGPEVARVADALGKILTTRVLVSLTISEKGQKNHGTLSYIPFPSKIVRVTSKGKKVLLYLTPLASGGKNSEIKEELIIANSLMMTGYWSLEEDKYTKFSMKFSEGDPIHFCSIRGFSRSCSLKNSKEKEEYFRKVGPDLLRDDITAGVWLERMRKMTVKRAGSRPFLICDALIEQKIFSGAGNYIRADAMYDAGIRPDKPVSDLSDEELEALRVAIHKVIRKSYKSEGYTIRDFKHVDGHPGNYEPVVYGREKDKLGNPVVRERFQQSKHKNRTVHWVPAVQRNSQES